MKDKELLKNLTEIRKSIQGLQEGMELLLDLFYQKDLEDDDNEGNLEMRIPEIPKVDIRKYRGYLG